MALHAFLRLPGVLLSLFTLAALASLLSLASVASAQPQEKGLVDLGTIPDNSVSSWSLQGPTNLRKESTPAQFKVTGPVVINVLQGSRPLLSPTSAEWVSSNLTSDPATWTALIASSDGSNEYANLTFENPRVQIWGGRFAVDDSTGDYSFKPNNTYLLFSRVSGTLFRFDVDRQNVVVVLPTKNIPTLSGTFVRRGPVFELISGGQFDIPLRIIFNAIAPPPEGSPPAPPPAVNASFARILLSLKAAGNFRK